MTEPRGLPRLLTIMGSGETTPTMVRVHRALLDRLGPAPVPAVLLDTPYGFQENADDISARALDYFRESVGYALGVASLRDAAGDVADPLALETALARIREARYVFSGPGSPTYALRQWRDTAVPRLLAGKLESGGAVTIASAAALTIGRYTIPVYEIYKAGEQPCWLDGLDLLTALGLPVAVVPHYDNAEGGNHDTRYCYLGERRLRLLEAELPDDVFVLGVDGHTALVLDLDARDATVLGLGSVTVRKSGHSASFPSGTRVTIEELAGAAFRAAAGSVRVASIAAALPAEGARPAPTPASEAPRAPLVGEVERLERGFGEAIDADAAAAVRIALELETTLLEWSRDTEQSNAIDVGRGALRAMIVRLGEAAAAGTRDATPLVAPFVDALVELRLAAREARDWAAADAIRDRLLAAGVEIHDAPDGTTWELQRGEPVR